MSKKYHNKKHVTNILDHLYSLNIDDHNKFYEDLVLIRNGYKTSDDEIIQNLVTIENGAILQNVLNTYEKEKGIVFPVSGYGLFKDRWNIYKSIYTEAFDGLSDIHKILEIAMDPESSFNKDLTKECDKLSILYASMYDGMLPDHKRLVCPLSPIDRLIKIYIIVINNMNGAVDSVGYNKNPAIKSLLNIVGTLKPMPLTKQERIFRRKTCGRDYKDLLSISELYKAVEDGEFTKKEVEEYLHKWDSPYFSDSIWGGTDYDYYEQYPYNDPDKCWEDPEFVNNVIDRTISMVGTDTIEERISYIRQNGMTEDM